VPTPLEEIAEPFQMVDRDMRIELLLEYARQLPPLSDEHRVLRDAGLNQVHECQAPVFLHVELDADGRVRLHADVPAQAPTARAFTAILVDAFDGARPEAVLEAPADALRLLGLTKLLGMQRTHGLSAIYQRVKREVARLAAKQDEAAS
jgi:cysteine desulfuration protein SufE